MLDEVIKKVKETEDSYKNKISTAQTESKNKLIELKDSFVENLQLEKNKRTSELNQFENNLQKEFQQKFDKESAWKIDSIRNEIKQKENMINPISEEIFKDLINNKVQ